MAYYRKSVAVLGGGITGLTAAFRLTALGHRARIFESSGRLGGVVRTEISKGWLVESGPNSLQEDSPEIGTLLHELGISSDRIEASPSAGNRYLAHDGRLEPVPVSLRGLALTPLFSAKAKWRILSEFCARRRVRSEDVSVAAFIRDHFGAEVLDHAVQPFVSGIWAGDASRLSVRAAFPKLLEMEKIHGSLLRGQRAAARARLAREGLAAVKTISFRRGMQTLPWALTGRLPEGAIVINAPVERLRGGPRWEIGWKKGNESYTDHFDAVVAPLPAASLALLKFGDSEERPLAALADIQHPPLVSLFLGFKREQVRHPLDGYGLLVPPSEGRSILGVIFSSSLFAGRAPPGCVALTVIAGGALQPDVAHLPLPQLIECVRKDLRAFLGAEGEPVFVRHTFWPRSIPQYTIGHQRYRDLICECEQAHPGLFIGGQVLNGVSISQCITAGYKLAERADLHP